MRRRFKDTDPTATNAHQEEVLRAVLATVGRIPFWESVALRAGLNLQVSTRDLNDLNERYSFEEQENLYQLGVLSLKNVDTSELERLFGDDWQQPRVWCQRHKRQVVMEDYTPTCKKCPCPFTDKSRDGRQRFCSSACKQDDYRRRKASSSSGGVRP